ncbi:MAG: glycogen/starch/alpha-glucan phosphorylase [Oscillospiraceae bacterium]|jgi:starch phosphorylase|nr:glycogen/starch/alpha-glucan phosphorylase [Oscillospiraceae bacterium]
MLSSNPNEFQVQIAARLLRHLGVTPKEASDEHFYKALAGLLRDELTERRANFDALYSRQGKKKVYYLCMEFLMGRSLKNTLYNLGLTEVAREALAAYDVDLDTLYTQEPDPGLGNGGLGRLAACYLDALASQGICATGYSILYDIGIFKQKLVDGWQTELPDFWLPGGKIWLQSPEGQEREVSFEGTLIERWEDGHHEIRLENEKTVTAVPYDLFVAGKDGKGISLLRLWSAKKQGIDMQAYFSGDYARSLEENAMAEMISKGLYPTDNHPEGKSLRLRQQYFLVSASMQEIVYDHLRETGSMEKLPGRAAIHINDTHPTLAIPELMRILLDECGFTWEDAWKIVQGTFAYTNHTVMVEALETWPEDLFARLLPRVYQIVCEISARFREEVWTKTHNGDVVERTAIISNGQVRMANLCVAACHHVNGVSALHSEILKEKLFADFYSFYPTKFTNVTNGIAHRRWLAQANPRLTELLCDTIGDGFLTRGSELEKFRDYADNPAILSSLQEIKYDNKLHFCRFALKKLGVKLNPDSIFDVQVKRLHEYKRQHMNALQILADYLDLKANPGKPFTPHTYLFAAKAAPGYLMAKQIIQFIASLGGLINGDPDVAGRMQVVFLENYDVTMAEHLMPAADLSEQISLAGTEASGTGNMKLMINGAVTLGTFDGANIEISEAAGEENIFIFGLRAAEADLLRPAYDPAVYYQNNTEMRRAFDFLSAGIAGKQFPEILNLVHWDPYMALADLPDYHATKDAAVDLWEKDKSRWNRMSLMNIAGAGRFAADRAVLEYADRIWGIF